MLLLIRVGVWVRILIEENCTDIGYNGINPTCGEMNFMTLYEIVGFLAVDFEHLRV